MYKTMSIAGHIILNGLNRFQSSTVSENSASYDEFILTTSPTTYTSLKCQSAIHLLDGF